MILKDENARLFCLSSDYKLFFARSSFSLWCGNNQENSCPNNCNCLTVITLIMYCCRGHRGYFWTCLHRCTGWVSTSEAKPRVSSQGGVFQHVEGTVGASSCLAVVAWGQEGEWSTELAVLAPQFMVGCPVLGGLGTLWCMRALYQGQVWVFGHWGPLALCSSQLYIHIHMYTHHSQANVHKDTTVCIFPSFCPSLVCRCLVCIIVVRYFAVHSVMGKKNNNNCISWSSALSHTL